MKDNMHIKRHEQKVVHIICILKEQKAVQILFNSSVHILKCLRSVKNDTHYQGLGLA